MQGKLKGYVFISITFVAIALAVLLIALSSQQANPPSRIPETAPAESSNPDPNFNYDNPVPPPADPQLTESEKQRYKTLEVAFSKKWDHEKQQLILAADNIGLSEDQKNKLLTLYNERNKEFLDLTARVPKDNLEYTKARNRLYKRFQDAVIKVIDRPRFQALAEKVPNIFNYKAQPGIPGPRPK